MATSWLGLHTCAAITSANLWICTREGFCAMDSKERRTALEFPTDAGGIEGISGNRRR